MNRGDYQNGWDTDQFPNSVDELALALYEILRAGGFTTGGFNFDAKLRRQSLDRTDLFHAHIGGIDTLARALLVAADAARARGPARRREERRYAGWDGPGSAPRSSTGGLSLAELEARVASRRDRPAPALGRAGAPREPRQPADLGGRPDRPLSRGATSSGSTSRRPRRRRILVDEAGSGRRHRHGRVRRTTSRGRSGASRTRSLWWDGAIRRDPARRSPAAGVAGAEVAAVGLAGQMHGAVLLDAADAGRCARRSCGTTSAPRAECDEIRQARRAGAADRDHRQRRAHRLHRARSWSGSATTSPRCGRGSPTSCCRRTTCGCGSPASYAVDKADGAGTLLFDLAARDWSAEVVGALEIDPGWLPRDRPRGPRSPASISAGGRGGHRAARRHAGGRRRRRPGGQCGRASAPSTRASWRCRSGRRASSSRATDRPLVEPRGPRPCLLPRGAGALAPDVGDALGGRAACAGSGTRWRPACRSRRSSRRPRACAGRQRRPLLPALPHRRAQPASRSAGARRLRRPDA